MRIRVLTNEYKDNTIGGLGTVATHLSKALTHIKGIHVTVLCTGSKQSIRITSDRNKTLQAVHFPRKSKYISAGTTNFKYIAITKWIRARHIPKPDLIHVHSVQCVNLALFYKLKYRIPVIYTCHSLAIRSGQIDPRQLLLFRHSTFVTTPSHWQKAQIIQYCPWARNKIVVIHNGVHIPDAQPNYKKNSHRLLFVGRVLPSKGVTELIRAIALLKVTKPNVQLDIIGTGSKKYMRKLIRLASALRISSNIRWLGKMNPSVVQQRYAAYGGVIVPSYLESFGLVALEAMAAGVPLVSTRNGGLGSFVTDRNATIISHINPHHIAQSVQAMWSNPTRLKAKVLQARQTARKLHWNTIANTYNRLFIRTYQRR
jgi:glycogen synthase